MQTPPALYPVALPRTAGLAIASLVLGILSITCFSILAGIPALILGAIAIKRIGRSAGTLGGKGQALAGLIMGGVSFALLPFTLAFAAGLFLPAFVNARAKAHEAQCLNNVRQCTLACEQYAHEHNTAMPNSWADVKKYMSANTDSPDFLHCQEVPDTSISYEITIPGKRLGEFGRPEEIIIVREIKAPHRGKRAVGFADGHVEMRAGE